MPTSMVNAYSLYKECTGKNVGIIDFQKEVIQYFTFTKEENNEEEVATVIGERQRSNHHVLVRREGRAADVMKHCKGYYKKAVQEGKEPFLCLNYSYTE